MSAGPHHRTLSAELRTWSPEQITVLLVRRPDLVYPDAPADIEELAQRAHTQRSIAAAIESMNLAENRLLQLVVCCRPDVTMAELARSLPDGTTQADIDPVLVRLEQAALIWRHNDRVHCSGTLRQCMPTTLGPPLGQLIGDQTNEYLRRTLRLVRDEVASSLPEGALPSPAVGPEGRPPRKALLVDELDAVLSTEGVVEALFAGGPAEAGEMAVAMASGRPAVAVEHPLYHSTYSSWYEDRPAYWLYERALILPGGQGDLAFQPRSVGVALRGGTPVGDLALDRPTLAVSTADPTACDTLAADRAQRTLDRLADVLEMWAVEPAKELKSGGLGVAVVRQLAARLEVDVTEAARLVEMLWLAGLIEERTVGYKQGRQYLHDAFVGPSPSASGWLSRPIQVRWLQLAEAWLRSEHWPSGSGRAGPTGKAVAVLTEQYRSDAAGRRAEVLAALAGLDDAPSSDRVPVTSPAALAGWVYWHRPQPWLSNPAGDPAVAIGWIYEEAESLGLVAGGRLATFGRALVDGHRDEAERGFAAALPAPATTFTVQADLTAVVVGTLAREVTAELRLLADVESTGAATTYRLSEAGIRRAIDAGRDAESILAFLDAHATRGIPRALDYLVRDVARRHGHLLVAAATTVITSDDPAVLADACSHRRTRKLHLELLASTVAVSSLPHDKVIAGLRGAGFFPAPADGQVAAPGDPVKLTSGAMADDDGGGELPERYATRAERGSRSASLDASAAAALAARIVGAPRAVGVDRTRFPRPTVAPVLPFDDRLTELDTLLSAAARDGHVVAVALGDEDDLADPMLLTDISWEAGSLRGLDVLDGQWVVIQPDHIGAVFDAGRLEDLLGGPSRSRSRQHRQRR